MRSKLRYVGLDVHVDSITVRSGGRGRRGAIARHDIEYHRSSAQNGCAAGAERPSPDLLGGRPVRFHAVLAAA
jgi:hypothetical protein